MTRRGTRVACSLSSPGPAPAPGTRLSRARFVRGNAVLRVRVPAAGRIAARGPGLRKVVKRVNRAGVYRISLRAKRGALNGKRARSRIRVVFADREGQRSSRTAVVRLKQPARSAKSSGRAK